MKQSHEQGRVWISGVGGDGLEYIAERTRERQIFDLATAPKGGRMHMFHFKV